MTTMLDRSTLCSAIRAAFEAEPWALALWEGGSASFGRVDQYSDLDLQLIVNDDMVAVAFEKLEQLLEGLGGIALRHRIPEPSWHGQSQCFYQLRDASPFLMLDFLIIRAGTDFKLTERELHGEPQVLFDKGGYIKVTGLDPARHAELLASRLETLRVTFPLFLPLVEKEILRGNALDAIGFYQAFAIRPLVEMLRIIHDPAKYNFGLRYLPHYLPADAVARLARLAYVTDLPDMQAKLLELRDWFESLQSTARTTLQA